METYDVCIVGGGLVGLSVARALQAVRASRSILILEKEDRVGFHQSGHNSGVIHSGLYYKPGSLKARLAVAGANALYELCATEGIPHRRSGKLVIATSRAQVPALEVLADRGRANGLQGLRQIKAQEIGDIEPAARGVAALSVPSAGVVDYPAVAAHLAKNLVANGADLRLSHRLTKARDRSDWIELEAADVTFTSRVMVNCAGLHSDRVAELTGVTPPVRIVPFRGEYYRLATPDLVKALIYPVPDPRFPFLGVHFTRRIDGSVEVGPNALVALGREHYRGSGPAWPDVLEMLRYRGFRRLATHNLVAGFRELINSRSRRLYARSARKLVPAVRPEKLIAEGAGVRAQAVDPNGRLVDDFVIESTARSIHVLNAPSPGATACLAIGEAIASRVGRLFAE